MDSRLIQAEQEPARLQLPGIGPQTVALITGGAGAIGGAVAAALLDAGARVAVVSRSAERAEKAAGELGGEVMGVCADVGHEGDMARAVDAVMHRWGRLDALVQSAAVSDSAARLEDVRADVAASVLATNLIGVLLGAQAAAPAMIAAGGGSIVNVSSISAHRAVAGRSVYSSSKAGVIQLTRQLAVELGPKGIRVNCVSPGQTPTVMSDVKDSPGAGVGAPSTGRDVSRIPSRRRGTLADFVGPILFLISDLAAYINGTDILVDGGASFGG